MALSREFGCVRIALVTGGNGQYFEAMSGNISVFFPLIIIQAACVRPICCSLQYMSNITKAVCPRHFTFRKTGPVCLFVLHVLHRKADDFGGVGGWVGG